MRWTPILWSATAIAVAAPRPARAQTEASLTLGSGTVRFPDGTSLGLFSVAPALEILGPFRQLTIGATVANLTEGGWYGQGRFSSWTATRPIAARLQLAADLDLSGTALQGTPSTGAGQLTAEVLWAAPQWGFAAGAGGTSGWGIGVRALTAPHARLRGWWQNATGRLALASDIQPTRFLGAWYSDIDAGVTARGDRFELRLWASGRVSSAYGSKLSGWASATWRVSRLLSFEAGGGSVLPDPFQGFPRSGFFTAGVRLHFPPGSPPSPVRSRANNVTTTRRNGQMVLRLRQLPATRVAIIGDWNGWEPTPLTRMGPGAWEIALSLRPGTYHYALLVDGVPWTAPQGVPTVPDGMGGRVAVLIVL